MFAKLAFFCVRVFLPSEKESLGTFEFWKHKPQQARDLWFCSFFARFKSQFESMLVMQGLLDSLMFFYIQPTFFTAME